MINMGYFTSSSGSTHRFCILLFSFILFAQSAFALEIRVRERASVKGEKICLADIAEFSPADDDRIPALSVIEISASPPPGNISRINEKLLIYRIGSAVARYPDIMVKVPDNLFIQRTAQIIDSDKIKAIFTEYIMNNCPYTKENILVTRVNTPGEIALPVGKLRWNIKEKDFPNYTGNVSVILDLIVDEKLIRKLPVSGVVNIRREVVKSARQIRKGEIIVREDLVMELEESMRPESDIFTVFDEVLEKRAVRTIQAGSTIGYGMVERPPIVKKGSHVLIKAENDSIKITTKGKVLQDGREGEQIKVVNISSGREIYAIVKGPGLVEVGF
ncbi:MAG: flagellar basal body P-ring formation protein FlgA [Deltaproteobacteria bacterium]|nr:flagellar basal body P-ring formation protein FlgA [Deltaproteobacteria bacterium]